MGSHSPLREEKVELRGVCQGLTQKVHLTGHHHQIGDWFRQCGMAHRFFLQSILFSSIKLNLNSPDVKTYRLYWSQPQSAQIFLPPTHPLSFH